MAIKRVEVLTDVYMAKPKRKPSNQGEQSSRTRANAGDPLAIAIGRRLVEAREGLGLSQADAAMASRRADPSGEGVSRSTLSLYETGINKPGARELVVLCEALKVTPNWLLYGSDNPARTLQASLDFLKGNELRVVLRLALAIMALDAAERDSFASLIFAAAGRKHGDVGLSSLMLMASTIENPLVAEIVKRVGEENKALPIQELMPIFVDQLSKGFYSSFGTLRPRVPDDQTYDFDPEKAPPPRRLKQR